jgi:hypothetical protein
MLLEEKNEDVLSDGAPPVALLNYNTNSISTVSVVWLIQQLSAKPAGNVARALSV